MKTLIAIPCMNMVPTKFMTALINLRKTEDTHYAVTENSLIYDSRNSFCANAIAKGYDRVLWLDSDMLFEPDLMERLNRDMDAQGLDYVSALCFKRSLPTAPCVYKSLTYTRGEDGSVKAEAVAMGDYPRNSLFPCAGTGFGAVMVSTDLIRAVWERFGPPFDPMTHMGEDLSFCWRVTQLGRAMHCDSRIRVGHIGQMVYDEQVYDHQLIRDEQVYDHQTTADNSAKTNTEGA